jgi:hypothetical protein
MLSRFAMSRVGLSIAAASLSLASCGGGGGKSAPLPTVTVSPVTPTPGATPSTSTCASAGESGKFRRAAAFTGGVNPNRVYVTYATTNASSTARAIDSVARSANSVAFPTDAKGAHRVVTLPSNVNTSDALAQLRATPGVTNVEPVHYRSASSDSVANDTYLNNVDQWYFYKTNVDPGAWALTHGSSSVSVAIIDTGVDESGTDTSDFMIDHQESDLTGVTSTAAGAAQDTNGHGTNVSGLAVAQTNNTYGFAGTGWSTHLQIYRIFPQVTMSTPCPTADTSDEALAINHAVANGASVINLSLGAPQSSGIDTVEQTAIEAAISAGVTVVAANGNEYGTSDGNQSDYPAGYAGVIGVGASAVTDNNSQTNPSYASITGETIATYSNSGPTLVAPGGDASADPPANSNSQVDILHWIEGYSTTTPGISSDNCSNTGNVCRVLFNGTSQATPQVAGVVALMMAYHGGARSLSPAQVETMLTASADVLPGIASTRQGAGRLDAAKAVAAAHP